MDTHVVVSVTRNYMCTHVVYDVVVTVCAV